MPCCGNIINELRKLATPEHLAKMAHFGIKTDSALGVTVKELRAYAKQIGKDHQRADDLWQTGIHEARLLACLTAEHKKLERQNMDAWVADMDSWDVCDICCMSLLRKHPEAYEIALQWSHRPEEFVRRAGLVMMTTLAVHDKKAPDYHFIELLPHITAQAADDRGYVKKAVSWALRQIGKRNTALNAQAIQAAEDLKQLDSPSARWIASDVLRELRSEKIARRLARQNGPPLE